MTHQITGSIYDYPNLYDVLFSDMCRSEIRFLTSMSERFSNNKESLAFFEPACGSGRLLYHLGKLGFEVAGLDLNPRSVAFCNRRLRQHGFKESAFLGNMASFSLADLGRTKKFDMAFNFVSSFLHLTTETEARNHFHAVADVLKPKGIYLLGIHLKPQAKQYCLREQWSMRRGSLSVTSHLKSLSQDLKKRIETIEFRIKAETPKKRYNIVDHFPFRIYSAEQFNKLLTAVNRFDVLETYSFDYDISRPVKVASDTEDVVFVLRKRTRG
jgi:SAM-dependent methyltransferase